MPTVWIVHREDRARAALIRLIGSSDAVIGRPSDPLFDAAPIADVVVLGLAGDWETELEFAHRQRTRLARAHWVLIGDKNDADAAHAQGSSRFLSASACEAMLAAICENARTWCSWYARCRKISITDPSAAMTESASERSLVTVRNSE